MGDADDDLIYVPFTEFTSQVYLLSLHVKFTH